MASTTPGRVRSIARHLKVLSDDDLQLYIDDAYQDIIDTYKVKNEAYHERLTRYLAAHLGTLNIRRMSTEKVSDMSKSYDSGAKGEGLDSTDYGQEFCRLLKQADGNQLGLVVV